MTKLWWLFSFCIILGLSSCRIEKADAVNFPNVDSYSPGYAKTGTEVSVIGSNLVGASLYLDGQQVDLSSSSDRKLTFLVTDAMQSGNIEVRFSNEAFEDKKFASELVVNHVITQGDKGGWLSASTQNVGDTLLGPNQLLISDFDGRGIRTADQTTQFDRTRFFGQVPTGGIHGFGTGVSGVSSSPAGGNYFYSELGPEFVSNGTFGYAGELRTRSQRQNDGITDWPLNFTDYPESPLEAPSSRADVADYYLNFALFKNQNEKTLLNLDLTNVSLASDVRFRNRPPATLGLSEWTWVSIPFTQFKTNFGNSLPITQSDFGTLNILSISFTHDDKKNNEFVEAEGDVNAYIDQIIITQGQPYYGHVR